MAIIKRIIKKYLLKAGIEVRRFPTPEQFYNAIKNKPTDVQEYELKRMTTNIRIAEDHESYEELLKLYVPNWQPDIEEAELIGEGTSESSLNTYRKVKIGDRFYFEKVYFNSYRGLKVVLWFEKHIYPLFERRIKPPRIQKTYAGQLVTIVYFEYLDLIPIERKVKDEGLIQFSKKLYSISINQENYMARIDLPDPLKIYKHRSLYKKLFQLAEQRMIDLNIDRNFFKSLVQESKCIITHGDIHGQNGFKNSILIDWDYAGFYPIGLEPADIYFHILKREYRKADNNIFDWLKNNYRGVVSEKDWPDFERNFTYFLFSLSIKRTDSVPARNK